MYPCCMVVAMVLHELGHYASARWYGVGIERAFLFLDANHRALWQRRIKGTVYGIGWLPVGAYLKLRGMERLMKAWTGQPFDSVVRDADDIAHQPPERVITILLAGGLVNMGCIVAAMLLPHGAWTLPWCVCHGLLLFYTISGGKFSDHWSVYQIISRCGPKFSDVYFSGLIVVLIAEWLTLLYVVGQLWP